MKWNKRFLNTDQGKRNILTGKAGELRVASEILLRGINVSFPCVDDGYDILTSGGKRIQVKTSISKTKTTKGYSYDTYVFNTVSKKYKGTRKKLDKTKIDFLICWCINDDLFYIIPVTSLSDTNINIVRNPLNNTNYKYSCYKDNWEALC